MVISVKTKDIVNNLDELKEQNKLFNFSNSNRDQKLFSNEFKKKPG